MSYPKQIVFKEK